MKFNKNTITNIIIPVVSIPTIDMFLCCIFGYKSRWFQLHSAINAIIVLTIYQEVIELFINPIVNNKTEISKIDSNYIILLHTYHLIIAKKLTYMDIFHHILFVGFGLVPTYIFFNNNLIKLVSFSTCGLTGCIEYFMLSLVKHEKMSSLQQKYINSYIYNYIRYPLTMYTVVSTYISYITNPDIMEYPGLLLYINLLLFVNGSYYNKITIENYIEHKKNN